MILEMGVDDQTINQKRDKWKGLDGMWGMEEGERRGKKRLGNGRLLSFCLSFLPLLYSN